MGAGEFELLDDLGGETRFQVARSHLYSPGQTPALMPGFVVVLKVLLELKQEWRQLHSNLRRHGPAALPKNVEVSFDEFLLLSDLLVPHGVLLQDLLALSQVLHHSLCPRHELLAALVLQLGNHGPLCLQAGALLQEKSSAETAHVELLEDVLGSHLPEQLDHFLDHVLQLLV